MYWHQNDVTRWQLEDSRGDLLAVIGKTTTGTWEIRVRNRSGGWTWAFASSKTAAQRKAMMLVRREAA